MRFSRMFSTIDTHTAGEPTRTIIGGIPWIPGDTMPAKMLHMKQNMDWIRRILMYEPRGHGVMSGAVLTQPTTPGADMGVIYMEVGGYLPMCGHDTIGCATAMVEAGIVPPTEPETIINLDTPAGLVRVTVTVQDGVAKKVTFLNIPSFVLFADAEVQVPGLGTVVLDVAYGGNMYAIVSAESIGLEIIPENATGIISTGALIRNAVNEQLDVRHPEQPFIVGCTHVEFSAPPRGQASARNAVVFLPGSIDRSPCGTGTSAKVATLYAKGKLGLGEQFVHESIIGTTFTARVIEETTVGGLPAIVPEVSGSAYVTGFHTFVFDPDDPVTDGFLLGQ